MGLNITAYRRLEKMDVTFDPCGEPLDPRTKTPLEGPFFRMRKSAFFAERADGLAPGIYRYRAAHGFRAGSYSSYSQWRDDLAKLAGYPEVDDDTEEFKHAAEAWTWDAGPFWALINFSDCEGTIGPDTSAELAGDFAEFQEQVDAHESEEFRELYAEWRIAFETAADGGAVNFH